MIFAQRLPVLVEQLGVGTSRDSLDEKLLEKIQKTYRPIIIPIPSRIKGISRTSYIERLLQRAIGYNIVIRR